jgi:ubiquinone/menaquinone biosynthesis C-methylase UbiE
MSSNLKDYEIQRAYYAKTATEYDIHLEKDWEHSLALHILGSYIEYFKIRSVLDIGAGTGRAMLWLKQRYPELVIKGIEPVDALREQAFLKGVLKEDLTAGDGTRLEYPDNSFDLVCEFAVLHHVREPNRLISEMSRVASKMIGISDCNFMGQGSSLLRAVKTSLYLSGLWKAADWVKTKGTGYTISEEDGLAYSYSIYQNLDLIKKNWNTVRITALSGNADTLWGQMTTSKQALVIGLHKREKR